MTAGAPPLNWIWGEPAERKAWRRYWIRDTLRGFNALFWHHLLSAGGVDWASGIGAGLGLAASRFYGPARRRVRANFARLRPDLEAETEPAMRRMWANMGRALAEVSVMPKIWDSDRTTVFGAEHIWAARATGRPRIYITLHMGNWELFCAKLIEIGESAYNFYLPQPNRFRRRISDRMKARFIDRLLEPSPEAARFAVRTLREQGEAIVFLIDESVGGVVQAPSFGRPLSIDSNLGRAVRFARMTDALVLPAYVVRRHGARYDMHVLPAVDIREDGEGKAGLMTSMRRLDALMAPIAVEHIDQWFMVPALDLTEAP